MKAFFLIALAQYAAAVESETEPEGGQTMLEDHDVFDCEIQRSCWTATEVKYSTWP